MESASEPGGPREVYVRPSIPRVGLISSIGVFAFGGFWWLSWRWLAPRLLGPIPPSPADGLLIALLPSVALFACVAITLTLIASYSLRIDREGFEHVNWRIDAVGRHPLTMMPSLRGFRWDEPIRFDRRSLLIQIGAVYEPIGWARFSPFRRRVYLPKLWIFKDPAILTDAIDHFAPSDHPLRGAYLSNRRSEVTATHV